MTSSYYTTCIEFYSKKLSEGDFLARLMWHAGILGRGKITSSLSLSYSHPDSSLFKLDLYLSQFSVSAQNLFSSVAENLPSTTI